MKPKLLIIDDMPEALVMLMAYLSGEGYEVITAQNGAEALSLLGSISPDIILSDIMMPKMGGFEFIDKLRRNFPTNQVPIIFMSAKNKDIAERMAIDLGATAFLEKPVSLTVVKAAIDAALKKAALEQNPPPETQINYDFDGYGKRQHERVQFICETYFEGGSISGLTVASNISLGGLFLDTFSNIPAGTLLHLRMKLRPGCEIEALGEVCYGLKGVGVGVKFIALDHDGARQIEQTITSMLANKRQVAMA